MTIKEMLVMLIMKSEDGVVLVVVVPPVLTLFEATPNIWLVERNHHRPLSHKRSNCCSRLSKLQAPLHLEAALHDNMIPHHGMRPKPL